MKYLRLGPLDNLARIRAHLPQDRHQKLPWVGVALVVVLAAAYCTAFAAALAADSWWLKLLFVVATGLLTGVLFVVGHDASHGSLCHSMAWNRWLARIAFLPSAHPNETWDSEHNRQHHSWTNLATKDTAYQPLTLEEYRGLSKTRRAWHRLGYQLPFVALGYLSIWWRGQLRILPARRDMVRSIAVYRAELVAIALFFLAQTALVAYFGAWSSHGVGWFCLEWLVCIALPFYVWNTTMAFVTIQHHTHPEVRWFDKEAEWSVFAGQVEGTVHVTWPRWFELAFHNIFEHVAHHVDKRIPLYNLRESHAALKQAYPGAITVQGGSLRHLLHTLRTCRLYDYRSHRWMDWDGRYTTLPTFA